MKIVKRDEGWVYLINPLNGEILEDPPSPSQLLESNLEEFYYEMSPPHPYKSLLQAILSSLQVNKKLHLDHTRRFKYHSRILYHLSTRVDFIFFIIWMIWG